MSALKNNTEKIQSLIEQANSLPAKTDGAVSYKVSQNLTEEEKTLARENINAAKNEHYEFIETVTIQEGEQFLRTKEPDGSPYNFSAVFFHVITPAGSTVPSGSFLFFKNAADPASGYFVHRWTPEYKAGADEIGVFSGNVYRDRGIWRWYLPATFGRNAGSPTMFESCRENINDIVGAHTITKLYFLHKFPAGTVISIYGVRA